MIEKSVLAVLVTVFALIISGCRKDLYFDFLGKSVTLRLVWPTGTTIPEGMRAIFYYTDGDLYTFNLPANGGTVTLPPGKCTVLLFNNDTEYLKLINSDNLSTIEAYTSLLLKAGDTKSFPVQDIVNMPDLFYTALIQDVEIMEDQTEPLVLEVEPNEKVYEVEMVAKIEGINNVASVTGYLSGMAGTYFPGLDSIPTESSALAFDFGKKGSDSIIAKIRTFGVSMEEPQQNIGRLSLTLINGEVRNYDYDLTDQMKLNRSVYLTLTIPETILVEDVSGNTGSGFDASVGEWEETDSEVPL